MMIPENSRNKKGAQLFNAVKHYKININYLKGNGTPAEKKQENQNLELALREISLLRNVQMCDNIVKLKEVYIGKISDQTTQNESNILTISIVMNLARYGSLTR